MLPAQPRGQSAPQCHNEEIESLFRFKGNGVAETISIGCRSSIERRSQPRRPRLRPPETVRLKFARQAKKCRHAVIRTASSPPISQFPGIEMMWVALCCGDTHTPLVSIFPPPPGGFCQKTAFWGEKEQKGAK